MNKLPSWKFWDWDSISKTVLVFAVIIVGLLVVMYYPEYSRGEDLKNLTERTLGVVKEVKPVKHVEMGFEGNKVYDRGYDITYEYKVDSKTYRAKDHLRNVAGNQEMINGLMDAEAKRVEIAYDPTDPTLSQIVLKKQ